jgi:hypothetical protein
LIKSAPAVVVAAAVVRRVVGATLQHVLHVSVVQAPAAERARRRQRGEVVGRPRRRDRRGRRLGLLSLRPLETIL